MVEAVNNNDISQFATSLSLVKSEITEVLDRASNELDAYSQTDGESGLQGFLAEIQKVRSIFKMLDFRVGERLCEEIADSGRAVRNQAVSDDGMEAFVQACVSLGRYVELLTAGDAVVASMLVPVINDLRKLRDEKPLPEAYFFITNLRPKLNLPSTDENSGVMPHRRSRQLFQVGLLALIKEQGKGGPARLIQRAVVHYERASRGSASWPFWLVVSAAFEALSQESFELTPLRFSLLGALDRQIRKLQANGEKAFHEKVPDWLLKEFVYWVALAEPESATIKHVQSEFQLQGHIHQTQLNDTYQKMRGPDQSAMESLIQALKEEMDIIKGQLDIMERIGVNEEGESELLDSLRKISSILGLANQPALSESCHDIVERVEKTGISQDQSSIWPVADAVLELEQGIRALAVSGLGKRELVDPVLLKEAVIALLSESLTSLNMIKRAISAFMDASGDTLHIRNVPKSLLDVSGALVFLDSAHLADTATELVSFIERYIEKEHTSIPTEKMDAFADAVTAIEYFMDSVKENSSGRDEALKLAEESLQLLKAS